MVSEIDQMTEITLKDASRIAILSGGEVSVLTGYLIKSNDNIAYFAKYADLIFSGISIMPSRSFEVCERDSSILFFEKAIHALDGGKLKIRQDLLECENLRAVFEHVSENKSIIVLEGRRPDEFEIVRVIGVSDNSIMIRILAASGEWESKSNWIKFTDISSVTLCDPYCVRLEAYFKLSQQADS